MEVIDKPGIREKLNNVFEISHPEPTALQVVKPPEPDESGSTEEGDFQFVRTKLYELIEQGAQLSKSTTELAQTSGDPEFHSAAARVQKEMREHILALASLPRPKKAASEAAKEDPNGAQQGRTTINSRAVFVGTTADLLKLMRKESERVIDATAEDPDDKE